MSGVTVVLGEPDPLLHLGPCHTVGVQEIVEVFHDKAFDVKGAANPSSLNTLDSRGHSAQDPHLVAAELEFPALDIGHLEPQLPDKVIVEEGSGGCGEFGRHQNSKRAALAGEHVLLVGGAVAVAGGEHAAGDGAVINFVF